MPLWTGNAYLQDGFDYKLTFRKEMAVLDLYIDLCTSQIEASTSPPPGNPRAFDTLSCPGRREFDHHS